jgi:hypothetical protein
VVLERSRLSHCSPGRCGLPRAVDCANALRLEPTHHVGLEIANTPCDPKERRADKLVTPAAKLPGCDAEKVRNGGRREQPQFVVIR